MARSIAHPQLDPGLRRGGDYGESRGVAFDFAQAEWGGGVLDTKRARPFDRAPF